MVSLNGRLVPESQAHLSIWDRGFTLGDAVFDTARTFRHRPFQLDRTWIPAEKQMRTLAGYLVGPKR